MKTLCLFTNEFPYGTWEAYLETEVKFYDQFDKVYVFALQLRKEHSKTRRALPENFTVIPIWYAPRWKYLINSIRVLNDPNLYKELFSMIKRKQLGIKRIIDLFVYLSRANYEMRKIKKSISLDEIKDAIFYSYRFEYQPYVALLLKKVLKTNNKIVSRAHRYDLYEEFRKNKYISCREILLKNIDVVYPCSEDGKKYLQNKFPRYKSKIKTSFLGTKGYGVEQYKKGKVLRIVSCSNVVPVKRLDLIIKTLMNLKDVDIEWTHFGDGILMSQIKELATKLPNNISVEFKGNIKNSDLMRIYVNNQFDLFVNVSISEGIPVSIMEALSFGIPCVATNVGGTNEIVTHGYNGWLLDENFRKEELENIIRAYWNLNNEQILKLRDCAYSSWKNKYDAEKNYSIFINKLYEM